MLTPSEEYFKLNASCSISIDNFIDWLTHDASIVLDQWESRVRKIELNEIHFYKSRGKTTIINLGKTHPLVTTTFFWASETTLKEIRVGF